MRGAFPDTSVRVIRDALDAMKPMGTLSVQTSDVAGGVEMAVVDP